jgi:hypothetical protein
VAASAPTRKFWRASHARSPIRERGGL